MTDELFKKVEKSMDEIPIFDAYLGYLRYEALRILNPRQFSSLWHGNLKGENFDSMIDELIEKNA